MSELVLLPVFVILVALIIAAVVSYVEDFL